MTHSHLRSSMAGRATARRAGAAGAEARLWQGRGRDRLPPAAAVEPSRVWMFALGDRLGVELEPITPLYHELPDVLARAAPCILQVRRDGVPSYLVLLGTRRGKLRLLACDATVVSVPTKLALALLREEQEATVAEVDQLLGGRGDVPPCARARPLPDAAAAARPGAAAHRLDHAAPAHREPADAAGRHPVARRRHPREPHAPLAGAGGLVLDARSRRAPGPPGDRLVPGWIAVIACAIPLRMLEVWWQGVFSIRLGTLLKQQLLAGILKLTPDEVRLDGIGRHFGRVAEAEVVEQLAVGGALLAVLSLVDLLLAGVILVLGAGGWLQATVLGLGSRSRSSSRAATTASSGGGRARASRSPTTCSSACSATGRGWHSFPSSAGTTAKTPA